MKAIGKCRQSLGQLRLKQYKLAFFAIAKVLAVFLGLFSLMNIIGNQLAVSFDMNLWWIDFRVAPQSLVQLVLLGGSILLIGYGVNPRMSNWRSKCTQVAIALFLIGSAWNTVSFYVLQHTGAIRSVTLFPLSLVICLLLAVLLWAMRLPASPRLGRTWAVLTVVMGALLFLAGFPLAQMWFFGKTDYRRSADVIVVPGARVYSDGTLSQALADRVRTACELYQHGLRVGIDHTASMVNTLFLAYAGASFPLLLLFSIKQEPFLSLSQILDHEVVATEIVRTLTGSIGLALAVPLSTLLAAFYISKFKHDQAS